MGESTHTHWTARAAVVIVCGLMAAVALPPPIFPFLPPPLLYFGDINYPSYPKYILLQTAVCLLLILWAYTALAVKTGGGGKGVRVSDQTPEILLAALLLLTFASAGWSGLPYVSMLGASVIGFRIGWGLLVSAFQWRGRALRTLSLWLIIAGLAASVFTILVMLFGRPMLRLIDGEQDLRHMVMGHRNILACFLIPPICVAALRAREAIRLGGYRSAAFPAAAAFIMLPVLLLTGSYGAMVGIVTSAIFIVFMLANRRWRRRMSYGGAIVFLIMILAATVAWPRIKPALMRHEQATRYFHTTNSLSMISERPILGWGAGAFMSRYPRFRHIDAERYGWMRQRSLHPHNEYTEMAIRVGIIGLALFLAALVLTMRRALKNLAGTGDAAMALAFSAGAVGMMAHGLFTVALGFWGAAGMFWTVIGALMSAGRKPSPEPSHESAPAKLKALPAVALVFVVAVSAVTWRLFAYDGFVSQKRFAEARRAHRAGEYDEAVPLYHEAISRMRYVPDYVVAHSYLGRCLAEAGEFERAAASMEAMRLLAPDLGALNTDLANIYARISTERRAAGDADSARLYMRRAAALYNAQTTLRPYLHAEPRVRLAGSLMSVDRAYLPVAVEQMRAAVILDEAFGKAPPDPVILFMLGRYLAEYGELRESLDYLERSSERRRELLPERLSAPDWTPEDEEDEPEIIHEIRALAETEYSIARVLIAMNRRGDARERLEKALRLWPGYPEAEGALGEYFGQ